VSDDADLLRSAGADVARIAEQLAGRIGEIAPSGSAGEQFRTDMNAGVERLRQAAQELQDVAGGLDA
jgi:hypothetical protein